VAKPAEAAKPAVEAKKEAPKKEAPPKPVMYRLGGQVTAVDMVAKKITISQNAVKQQKKATLKVGKKAAAGMSGINVGDVVNVWVTDGTVTTLTKIY
jgi:Cu/Ag efflux protein CusF